MRIDHAIWATADLDAAAARFEREYALVAGGGGRHEGMGTHNRIVPLGGAGEVVEVDETKIGKVDGATRCAHSGLMPCSKPHSYSITLSARASNSGEMLRPSALAALRLMTRSNLVGCSIGSSAGLAPLRILCT